MQREFTLTVEGAAQPEPIAVLERSQGDHPLIAWHGIGAVNRYWRWDMFWDTGQVLLAGLPGHGPVPHQPADHYDRWSQEHFIDVGAKTLRELAGGRRATLIGHSTGGMVALGAALAAPELVERLILISPVVWGDLGGIVALWARLRRRPRLQRAAVEAALAGPRLSPRLFAEACRAYIHDARGFYGNPAVWACIRDGHADYRRMTLAAVAATARVIGGADLRPAVRAARPTFPTLVLTGDRDGIVPPAQAAWLAQALPGAELAIVPGTGHICYAEREPRVNELITGWIARRGERTTRAA